MPGKQPAHEQPRAVVTPPRVLIVDDDVPLAKALSRLLALEGFAIDAVTDGSKALERLSTSDYDVVLLDLRMPNMDGMEVFQRLRGCASPPATILHSAFLDVHTAVLATRAGIRDVLQKPVPEPLLASRIRELTAERRAGAVPKPTAEHEDALSRLIGETAVMREVREQVRRIARFQHLPVLIEGPTGTGKELVAAAIHALTRPDGPFVSLNCAAVSEHLFESELFGHEAGSFTNAKSPRVGLFEEAGAGTIFLDEVGEMPLGLQAKLLRVLETREFRRVGSNRERSLNARVVSATNRPLTLDPRQPMRADLYFRLAGYTINTPALSEHLADLPLIASHIAKEFSKRHQLTEVELSEAAVARLSEHAWPGNVRELRVVVERARILATHGEIGALEIEAALGPRGVARASDARRSEPTSGVLLRARPIADAPESAAPFARESCSGTRRIDYDSLPQLQREVTLQAFEDAQRNLSVAARELGIPRSTLRNRLRKYGVH